MRDKFQLQRDNGEFVYLMFIDFETPSNNEFQVSNQITGVYKRKPLPQLVGGDEFYSFALIIAPLLVYNISNKL